VLKSVKKRERVKEILERRCAQRGIAIERQLWHKLPKLLLALLHIFTDRSAHTAQTQRQRCALKHLEKDIADALPQQKYPTGKVFLAHSCVSRKLSVQWCAVWQILAQV
jgi:hypothetical protein